MKCVARQIGLRGVSQEYGWSRFVIFRQAPTSARVRNLVCGKKLEKHIEKFSIGEIPGCKNCASRCRLLARVEVLFLQMSAMVWLDRLPPCIVLLLLADREPLKHQGHCPAKCWTFSQSDSNFEANFVPNV